MNERLEYTPGRPRVKVGDMAPDFTLPSTEGEVTLSAQRGKPVLLVFYPGDDTPVCTVQLNEYNDSLDQFDGLGATVWAISPQSVESHRRFSEAQGGFGFPMLADESKTVFQAYGCLGPLGFPRRSVFVVGPDGRVTYAHRTVAGLSYRPVDELAAAVRSSTPG